MSGLTIIVLPGTARRGGVVTDLASSFDVKVTSLSFPEMKLSDELSEDMFDIMDVSWRPWWSGKSGMVTFVEARGRLLLSRLFVPSKFSFMRVLWLVVVDQSTQSTNSDSFETA